ncbi:MAG: 16S rRNA (cytosine(967)-C(5))-methyltransferase RsmB [Blastocatellia bacterium]|nr:16S rRNA (cytosine(967)-C(5))-methyltransferase RsmB [Blastocatellia bacterium]
MPKAPRISPARKAAFDVLWQIERERAYSSVVLPREEEKLSEKDRRLCHEITLGVLRKCAYLDRMIAGLAGKKKLDLAVLIALRIGLYQLIFLNRVPDYSAINESVNLVVRAKKMSARGFVNAILRRAVREKPQLSYANELERVSVETSHPEWLIRRWEAQFGMERAFALARSNNVSPLITFRDVNAADEIERLSTAVTRCKFASGCYTVHEFSDEIRELAQAGLIYLQDEASQLVASTIKLEPRMLFSDVCAAPGGKTTAVALRSPGSLIVSGDIHLERVRQIGRTAELQKLDGVNQVQYDAETALPFADGTFDVVLVDAPCTGTGTIRHNPEIVLFLNPEVFAAISAKQLNMLRNASKTVKSGGRLIYSTCSLEFEENERICERFLASNDEFEVLGPDVDDRFLTEEGFARTFPDRDDMDGFFIAHFTRK